MAKKPAPRNAPILDLLGRLDDPEHRDLMRLADATGRAVALFKPYAEYVTRPPEANIRPWSSETDVVTRVSLHSFANPLEKGSESQNPNELFGGMLDVYHFDHFDLYLRHGSVRLPMLRRYCNELRTLYSKAAENADIVVANELAFPSFWQGRPVWQNMEEDGEAESGSASYIERAEVRELRRRFERQLQEIANEVPCIILPGTYHDPSTFENILPIKFPNPQDSCDHVKRTTAKRAGEFVKISRLRRYPVYNYGNFTFSILICSDIYDLNIFFRQFRRPHRPQDNAQVYFVPSFQSMSRNAKRSIFAQGNAILESCADLSWATGSVVIYVNYADREDTVTRAAWFAGNLVREWRGAGTSTFDIEWRVFHEANQAWLRGRSRTMVTFSTTDLRG